MIDNFKISLNIKRWKQRVQLISTTIQKYIIGKINAIVRLKKRQAKIIFKDTLVKMIKKREALILAFSGYQESEFFNALASASFLLIIVKISYYCLFYHQIPFKVNLLLLLGFWGLSLIYSIHFYIRFITFKIIRKSLSKYFFGLADTGWDEEKTNLDYNECFIVEYVDKNWHIIKLPIEHWYRKITLFIFTVFIQIRLFMLSEPYLFFFGRFIVVYWLIFNKFLIVTYFISLIVLVGRYVLLYQDNDLKSWKKRMVELDVIRGEGITIKATKKNAFIILTAITLQIRHRNVIGFEEKYQFNIKEKELNPKFKFIEKYIKPAYMFIIEFHSMVMWKLKNYYANLDYYSDIYVEEKEINKYLKKALKILLFLSLSFSCSLIYMKKNAALSLLLFEV